MAKGSTLLHSSHPPRPGSLGHRRPSTVYRLPSTVCWLLATGYWLLLPGCRLHSTRGMDRSPLMVSPSVSAGAARFTDATAAAGIHFKHTNGRSGRLYFPETTGSGCAFLDYD